MKNAQKIVGEQLWLTMRSRPDLQFPVAFMASKVSKQPNHVAQVGRRVLAYLKSTQNLRMIMGPSENRAEQQDASDDEGKLVGYSDASFSPYGEKSYGASVVTVLNTPIAWKSSKQSFVTLSVMEAELYETTNAIVLMESIGSLLDEVIGDKATRVLRVDNSSALAMVQGGQGSWRTRHLKVRSAKIRDMVQNHELTVEHITGDRQVADLATKMHPKMRLWELLLLWGFRQLPLEATQALNAKGLYMSMLVLALMFQTARAEDQPTTRTIQSVGIDELLMVTLLVCVAAIAVWEAAKGCFSWVRNALKESPKQRRLRKLRDAAKAAAEEEVDRAFLTKAAEPVGDEPHDSEARSSTDAIPPPPPPQEVFRRQRAPRRVEHVTAPPPHDEPEFELYSDRGFYKTVSSKSKLHTNPHCHGLRNAGDVYTVEYCQYCQRANPLYSKRSRSLQPRLY